LSVGVQNLFLLASEEARLLHCGTSERCSEWWQEGEL